MRDGHVGLSPSEQRATTKVVNKQDGGNSKDKVDDADNTGGEKGDGWAGETDLLKDGRSVVNNCLACQLPLGIADCSSSLELPGCSAWNTHVDTGPLLQSLRTCTQHQSMQQRLGCKQPLVL
jgi:hypothetical protein